MTITPEQTKQLCKGFLAVAVEYLAQGIDFDADRYADEKGEYKDEVIADLENDTRVEMLEAICREDVTTIAERVWKKVKANG